MHTLKVTSPPQLLHSRVLVVPDVLGGQPEAAERFIAALGGVEPNCPVALDLDPVTFVHPSGALLLHQACQLLMRLSCAPVEVFGMRDVVHAYLERIDFFTVDRSIVRTDQVLARSSRLGRSSASLSVMPLRQFRSVPDIYRATADARRILGGCLGASDAQLDHIATLLGESCGNVVEHSATDPVRVCGTMAIQRYQRASFAEIHIAIGDLGRGIRCSLEAKHGALTRSSAALISAALTGYSGRLDGTGGDGLPRIRDIAVGSGGRVVIRSGTGSVVVTPAGERPADGIVLFPGTQLGITIRS